MARRAAHVDIDHVGAGGFGDPCALCHPVRLAARELNDVRAYSRCLAAQLRHGTTVDEVVAGGHLGNNQSGAERGRQLSKRGIGDARHRREKDPVGEFDIAYFQRLRA